MNKEDSKFSDKQYNKAMLFGILGFLALITAVFYFLIVPTLPKYTSSTPAEELENADLSRETICITSYNMEEYPGCLYTSEDFEDGTPASGDQAAKYRTYRIVLKLQLGRTYGLTGESASYAQRLYVNGVLLDETGNVSDNADDFCPKTDRFTVYFTPETEETEIIIQHAFFNHKSGSLHKNYLAEQQVIDNMNRSQTFCDGLFSGMVFAIGLFFLGMFFVNLSNRSMLWFSLSCICAAVNYLIYESKQIMVLFPDLNWYFGHKTELITTFYYFVFLTVFAYSILNCKPPKRFSIPVSGLVALATGFVVAAPSTVYVYYMIPIDAVLFVAAFAAVVYLIVSEIRQRKILHWEDLIICIALLLALSEYFVEGVTYFQHVLYLRIYLQILLSFLCALVLMINHIKVKRDLNEAEIREKQVEQENDMLEKMNSMKTGFMRNVAHELKTPLAVMSGYAQLTDMQIKKDMVDEETSTNLATITKEADRLSQMVAGLLNVTYGEMKASAVTVFTAKEILEDAAAVCRPILLKRKNSLEIICDEGLAVLANRESLLQVLINLSVNAGKHTSSGRVTYSAGTDEATGMVLFTVSDTGEGIAEDILPHVFERGYTTDGGNGLGLPICREIIETTGGGIYIKKTGKGGTTICFTVPVGEEEKV